MRPQIALLLLTLPGTSLTVNMEDSLILCQFAQQNCFTMAESASGCDEESGEVLSWNHGLKAEDELTALIVSSCIAGVLFFVVILASALLCFTRWRRTSKKIPKPSETNGGLAAPPVLTGDPSPPPRSQTFTQHALLSRHRPPVQFYTLRSDARQQGLQHGAPMELSNFFTESAAMGRPVLYLDMLDPGLQGNNTLPRHGPHVRRYRPMDPSPVYYADGAYGGLAISEMQNGDDWSKNPYKRKHRKSRRRSGSRSRGHTDSESRDRSRSREERRSEGKQKSRASYHEETPVLAMPGDIILTDIRSSKRASPGRHQSAAEFLGEEALPHTLTSTTVLQDRTYTMTFDQLSESDLPPPLSSPVSKEERRVDTARTAEDTSLKTHAPGLQQSDLHLPPDDCQKNPTSQPDPLSETLSARTAETAFSLQTAGFHHYTETVPPEDYEVPFEDYMGQPVPPEDYKGQAVPPSSHVGKRHDTDSDGEPVNNHISNHEPVQSGDEGDTSIHEILNSLHLSSTPGVSPTSPSHAGVVKTKQSLFVRQLSSEEYRPPTPPPDMADQQSDDWDGEDKFSMVLAKARPPTPPPDRRPSQQNQKQNQKQKGRLLADLQRAEGLTRADPQSSTPAPPYAFMGELKRRQRHPEDDDTDKTSSPPSPSSQASGDKNHDPHLNLDSWTPQVATLTSRVSFTTEPPEIIPRDDPEPFLSLSPDYDDEETPTFTPEPLQQPVTPPPPPPPPPPLPPAPPSFSTFRL